MPRTGVCNQKKKQEENKKRITCLNERFNDKQEGIDFIIGPICFQKVREISRLHAIQHGFAFPKELANEYGLKFTFLPPSKTAFL